MLLEMCIRDSTYGLRASMTRRRSIAHLSGQPLLSIAPDLSPEPAAPVIEAALRAQIPYLDVAAEIEANADTFEQYADRAREAGIVIVPAMAFYGGLGDLLATAAMGDWMAADEICIAYALSSWKPTLGTRATTQVSRQRRAGRRLIFSDHRMQFRTDDAPVVNWTFPPPIGTQVVVGEFTTADSVTIPRHLRTPEIRTYMTLAPLKDLDDPDLSPPPATDNTGRSAQTFLVEVVARVGKRGTSGSGERTRYLRDHRTPRSGSRSTRRQHAGQDGWRIRCGRDL